jgi:hypothetical protein
MSISLTQGSIDRLEKEILSLDASISADRTQAAKKQEEIGRILKSITKNTSPSMLSSKRDRIRRLDGERIRLETRAAESEAKRLGKAKQLREKQQQLTRLEKRQREAEAAEERRRRQRELSDLRLVVAEDDQDAPDSEATAEPEAAPAEGPISLFYSYAHEDEHLRGKLEAHLAMLRREGAIREWHDRKIGAGQELDPTIRRNLEGARIILLLVSPSFIASEYCWGKEMARAMEKHRAGEARVIPVILRPVDWDGAPFRGLLALPRDAKPVTSWRHRDEAWLDVAKGIRGAVEDLRAGHPTPPGVEAGSGRGAQARRPARQSLTREAEVVLRHLVLDTGLGEQVPVQDLAEELDLSATELGDAVEELGELGLVEPTGRDDQYGAEWVEPTALAWLRFGEDELGFDAPGDQLAVARAAVRLDRADAETLQTDTGLPVERLNVAALGLEALDLLTLHKFIGTAPYHFGEVRATRRTRQYVRQNEPARIG